MVHGYNSTGFIDFATVGLEYIKRGYNILLVTNRACGESEGKWTGFGTLESEDNMLWLDKITSMYPTGDIILQGCSLGGATVLMMSNRVLPSNVKAIIADCAFDDVRGELEHTIKFMAHIPPYPLLNLVEKWCKKLAGYDFDTNSPIKAVKDAKVPIFFVHGKADRYIPYATAEKLYEACPTEKELLLVDNAAHAASHLRGKDKYYNAIFKFIDKYTIDKKTA